MSDRNNGGGPWEWSGSGWKWRAAAQFHIYVAQDCNLACSYCFNLQGTFGGCRRRMTPETAHAATAFILEHRDTTAPVLSIRFFGGEPLLARESLFAMMRGIRRRFTNGTPSIRFSIDTNGTLIDRAALQFFESTGGVQLNISLDGGATAHNACRHGDQERATWKRVVRNLRHAQDYRIEISANAVLTAGNCDAVAVTAQLRKLGCRSITLTPVWHSPLNPGTCAMEIGPAQEDQYLSSMSALLSDYFAELESARSQGRLPAYYLSNAAGVIEAQEPPSREQSLRRCKGGALAIDADGNLLPCAALAHLPRLRVGHITTGMDDAAVARFLGARLSITEVPRCATCWARRRCGGPCLQFVSPAAELESLEPPEAYCRMRRREIRLNLMALRVIEREHGAGFRPLMAFARDWLGCGSPPAALTSDSLQKN